MTQAAAAALAEVSAPTWCDWERGQKNPRGIHREVIEALTGVPGSAWNDADDLALLERVRQRAAHPAADESRPSHPAAA